MSTWSVQGEYMETCNCTFVCPCIATNLLAKPTEGDCKAALALRIDQGEKDGVRLDGLAFVVMLHSPGPMADGNITVGLIVDEQATPQQVQAVTDIATGAAGGPMAALAPLVGRMAGVERRAIEFEHDGLSYSVHAGDLLDQACDGLPSVVAPGEAIGIYNVAHPINTKVSLAKATRSRFHAFGIDWEDASGTRNGHFAPFSWSA
jgi:hypothetical protein